MSEKKHNGITILGLGPGNPDLITKEAWSIINSAPELYLRTDQHPCIKHIPDGITKHSFDYLYEENENFDLVYKEIVSNVINLGQRPDGVIYAVPGHPFVAESTTPMIIKKAKQLNIPIHIVEGLSFLEPTFSALEIDPFDKIVLLDAFEIAVLHHPNYSPSIPALITQIYSRQIASEVKLTLMAVFPDDHEICLIHCAGTEDQLIERVPLYEMDRSGYISLMTNVYIPSLDKESSFEEFQEIVAHLRAPDGCPWDKEQTHNSLRPNLLEETYETLSALDNEDYEAMEEEFGDLLLQIVLHAQIASEAGEFNMNDVVRGINKKIVHRHPHVFGDLDVENVDGVLLNWEKLKAEERKNSIKKKKDGLLDSVPTILPSLELAQEYQARVARVGFDWKEISGVLQKVKEEFKEVKDANSTEETEKEIGDLLFSVVNLARWLCVNAESALRMANNKFKERFKFIEKNARESDKELSDMTLDEMDTLWDKAKGLER